MQGRVFKEMDGMEFSIQERIYHRKSYEQIADIRVFTLGYCTREVMLQLKKQSAENRREMERVSKEYREVIASAGYSR